VFVGSSSMVPGQKALIARDYIEKGSLIFSYSNWHSNKQTRTSIQIGILEHIEAGVFGSYANHSCQPNCAIKGQVLQRPEKSLVQMYSISRILKGQELCFDYASTETSLTPELIGASCLCASQACRGRIKHFLQLSEAEKKQLLESGAAAGHIHLLQGI
jgi:hypothetical protein